ncbi:STM4015 family protein [Streptomyces sp. TP-A0356]|uniref:STM4015 family protein n=1 Tax=Streptomyces sp. TP-A0356 TaxID=1359208 RepID=UPI0006E35DD8|nr:STM4015 family protein [Streptomyces sp. TP-A0356]
MTIGDHLQELYGLPAFVFPGPDEKRPLPEPDSVAWRITSDVYDADEDWEDAFARFCSAVDTTRVRALIVGAWQEAYDTDPSAVIEALVAARDRLPDLRALFLGDMVMEECEISWINQTDVTGLLAGFPRLEEFGVRGGSGLRFPAIRHDELRSLTVQTGGLPVDVVRGIGASELPALVHLDLWLGTSWYGADCEVPDLEPILSGTRLPSLRHLALRNSEIQDDVAAALASAPVLARLDVLDLSMGTLSDEGAVALLGGQPLTHLKKLDLHHHYLSEPVQQRIRQTLEPAGVELNLDRDDADEDEDDDGTVHRYVAVGE